MTRYQFSYRFEVDFDSDLAQDFDRLEIPDGEYQLSDHEGRQRAVEFAEKMRRGLNSCIDAIPGVSFLGSSDITGPLVSSPRD